MASEGTGGLALPPKNEELRKQEEEALHGANITVQLQLPDGSSDDMVLPVSKEVGYVKLMLSQKLEIPYNKISLYFKDKPMIDPMSFCDHPGVAPPIVTVRVEIAE
ncbi:unnamed protein product [Vitrella brassicaformis CCMP3155]|uniref:Ubiquitin-like domain-containing protein n=1 Tax=Vitrella brassicaformis (strain CCMP3155) TaxID=1169540 RepID=A0A0G4FLU3_VITBC|nr:unnamed protein product [Vitrella brassicaformis CCMP3155]|mmetsp:Transcript_100/g.342  ORF Transcript_100/g.342 Transcript_100/m.342 type:complete len:106 (+) Transcript_100:123-440(+)|eukprot:CEM14892.1 unnamed protein product [Vitrella brassicaformis CCMP3155]